MVLWPIVGHRPFKTSEDPSLVFLTLMLMCPDEHKVDPGWVSTVLKCGIPFSTTMRCTKIKFLNQTLKFMFICLSSQAVFSISGFDGWRCNIQRGVAVSCNQEHVVLGDMFDGLLEGFPNQSSFMKKNITRLGDIPCNLIYIKDIMHSN